MVPSSRSRGTPCSSPATMKKARIGITAPFMVIETDISPSGMPSKRIFMSSTVDRDARLADVADDAGVIRIVAAMGGEIESDDRPFCPPRGCGGRRRWTPRRSKTGILPDRPGAPAYIEARTPRVKGAKPGRPGSQPAHPPRCRAGLTVIPSGVCQSRSRPFTSRAASAFQSHASGVQCPPSGASISSTRTPPMSRGCRKTIRVPCAPKRGVPSARAPRAVMSAIAASRSATSKQRWCCPPAGCAEEAGDRRGVVERLDELDLRISRIDEADPHALFGQVEGAPTAALPNSAA